MTHKAHDRSPPSPEPDSEPALLKRLKSSHISDSVPSSSSTDPTPHFAPDLFGPSNIHRLHTEYEGSAPFKHVVVEKLFQDDLLQNVKDEALAELSFSEKETDIYKVRTLLSHHLHSALQSQTPHCSFAQVAILVWQSVNHYLIRSTKLATSPPSRT